MADNKRKFKHYDPCSIVIYNRRREILLEEPSLIAVDVEAGMVKAVGREAQFVQDQGETLMVTSPLRGGAVADFDLTKAMFEAFLKKIASGPRIFSRPKIAVCAPIDMTQVEERALREACLIAGAKGVLVFEERVDSAWEQIPPSYKIIIEIVEKR